MPRSGFKPRTVFLWGNSVNHHNTVLPRDPVRRDSALFIFHYTLGIIVFLALMWTFPWHHPPILCYRPHTESLCSMAAASSSRTMLQKLQMIWCIATNLIQKRPSPENQQDPTSRGPVWAVLAGWPWVWMLLVQVPLQLLELITPTQDNARESTRCAAVHFRSGSLRRIAWNNTKFYFFLTEALSSWTEQERRTNLIKRPCAG